MAANTGLAPGDLNPVDFPEALQRLVVKVNEAVRKARFAANRAQNSPDHFRVPAAEVFASTKAVQVLLGSGPRAMLEQLADWREIGVGQSRRIRMTIC